MANFDYELLDEIINNAPTAGFGPRVNYGKMTIILEVTRWDRTAGKFVTRTWDGKPLSKEKGEYFQITFKSDMSEFNPALTGEYKRRVDVKKSSNKGRKDETLTDWTETVEQSLLKVFGKGWAKALTKGVYAEWQDIETVEKDKEGRPKGFNRKDPVTKDPILDEIGNPIRLTNSVPQFLRMFKSKAECEAARAERYVKSDEDVMAFPPDSEIPSNVINEVKGIVKALKPEELISLLTENTPYSQYDLVTLLEAAGASENVIALAQEEEE